MINSLKLKNFRSFKREEFHFSEGINLIIGDNGKGKSNILEAINLALSGESLNKIPFENLVNKASNENLFFIQGEFFSDEKILVSDIAFDKENNRRKVFLNKKATTKNNLKNQTFPVISFSPIDMNLMYLSPILRRDFIKKTLIESFQDAKKIIKEYEDIVRNRNKILKNIKEGLSQKSELNFWNSEFIDKAVIFYTFIEELILFYSENITSENEFFLGKFDNIEFNYLTKINFSEIKTSIIDFLSKNEEKEIILGRTLIGPHCDDFNIYIDGMELVNVASRGETKSVILGLKFLELEFVENKAGKKSILLIDDLISELDEKHKKMLLNRIKNNQSIIANIFPIEWESSNTIKL